MLPGDLVVVRIEPPLHSVVATSMPGTDSGNDRVVFAMRQNTLGLVVATCRSDLGMEAMLLHNDRYGWVIQSCLRRVTEKDET